MDTETIRLVVEGLFFPILVAVIIWAVTRKKTDDANVKKTLAEATKAEAEGEVAEETVEAAVHLADIGTLQQWVITLTSTFKEERESLTRQADRAEAIAERAITRVDELQEDLDRTHRELIDMYRRDQYYGHLLKAVADWIEENLDRMLIALPTLSKPPTVELLPPLHVDGQATDIPSRRWYDKPEEDQDAGSDTQGP